jgi:DNA-binding response OmpR family regulator
MGGSKKILIVDDEPLARELLSIVLERAGYEVISAEDGATAVEKASSERPDLVITDGLLPKVHGFLVCKAIKEMADPPAVIMLTGVYTRPSYRWEIKHNYHADEVMNKPFDTRLLLNAIARLLPARADDRSVDNAAPLADSRQSISERNPLRSLALE